ncbi:MAG: hypothetical protein R3C28_30185 [Pirellulaceae bacterium]
MNSVIKTASSRKFNRWQSRLQKDDGANGPDAVRIDMQAWFGESAVCQAK